jgi:hypothetical protein
VTPDEIAQFIFEETRRRGYQRHETVAVTSTGLQESGLRMVWSSNHLWFGVFQQDEGYPNRMDPKGNVLGFLDRLDVKRQSPGASPDIWKTIFWLQQRPSEPTAEDAYRNGRQAYLTEIQRHITVSESYYDKFLGGPVGWTGDPVWLADVLRAEGLRVVEYEGWRNRGHGDFGDIWGVMCHHTGNNNASAASIAIGRPDLAGPLSQLHLAQDGTVTIVAVGVAWHAGVGSYPGVPTNNGNWHLIGIEAANDGGGSPGKPHRSSWPDAQYDAYVRICAALVRKLGYGADRVIGHKDYAGAAQGKWDPGAIDMNQFRRDVATRLSGAVANAIDEAYQISPWLGERLTPELATPDGRGRYAGFENGHVYWTGQTGAWPIPKLLFETYAKLGFEAGPLRYPTRFHSVVPDVGDIQAFEGGVLYRKYGKDGFFVHGKIGDHFAAHGYEQGALGWPTSNETAYSDGIYQDFENGRAVFSPSGVVAIRPPANLI